MPVRQKRTVQKSISLLKLEQPRFLSVVGSPANRTGFKVVRKDENGNTKLRNLVEAASEKREDAATPALLSLSFPDGLTLAEVNELLEAFGMETEYEVRGEDGGQFIAYRRNCPENVETIEINTGMGYVATLALQRFSRSDVDQVGVTLVGLEFDEAFSEDKVRDWLETNGVVIDASAVEVCEGGFAVTRHALPEDGSAHVKKLQVEAGVYAVVAATQRNDVPIRLYRSVVEKAYGNWGWGHLNFASALVDPEFSEKSYEAIDALEDVLENIVLYSGLPLEDRKQLMRNALSQFGAYLEQMMDALPRETMDTGSKRNDSKSGDSGNETEASDMTKETQATGDKATNEKGKDENQTQDFVTRSDLQSAVTEAISAQLAPAVTEAITAAFAARNDGESGEGEEGEGKEEEEQTAAVKPDTAVLDAIKEMRSDFTARMDKVEADLKEVSEGTFARSDDEDGDQQNQGAEAKKRDDSGPFTGMFNKSFGLSS